MSNKLTLLEQYWKIRLDLHDSHSGTLPTPTELWSFQELLYRIEVLESLKYFTAAAPTSTDMSVLIPHYKRVAALVENLKKERDFPAAPNDDLRKQRETAYASLCSVIEDCRKRYGSYAPQSPEQYSKDIGRTVGTILPAWIQYRNTVNEIKLTEESHNE